MIQREIRAPEISLHRKGTDLVKDLSLQNKTRKLSFKMTLLFFNNLVVWCAERCHKMTT